MDFRKVEVGQKINFAKDMQASNKLVFNVNWSSRGSKDVDLDAFITLENRTIGSRATVQVCTYKPGFIARLFGKKPEYKNRTIAKNTEPLTVYFGNCNIDHQGIKHHGDDTTGAWSDGEFIEVDLDTIPKQYTHITFSVLSWSGDSFSDVPNTKFSVYNGTKTQVDKPLVQSTLKNFNKGTDVVAVAQMVKTPQGWQFKACKEEFVINRRDKVSETIKCATQVS